MVFMSFTLTGGLRKYDFNLRWSKCRVAGLVGNTIAAHAWGEVLAS